MVNDLIDYELIDEVQTVLLSNTGYTGAHAHDWCTQARAVFLCAFKLKSIQLTTMMICHFRKICDSKLICLTLRMESECHFISVIIKCCCPILSAHGKAYYQAK